MGRGKNKKEISTVVDLEIPSGGALREKTLKKQNSQTLSETCMHTYAAK